MKFHTVVRAGIITGGAYTWYPNQYMSLSVIVSRCWYRVVGIIAAELQWNRAHIGKCDKPNLVVTQIN
jgi:hypothetical protein